MKTYQMKLLPEYFNYIKKGTKRIELRLYDEKRKSFKINDIIVFENINNNNEHINARIKSLYKYDNFEKLISDFDIELLADKNIKKEKLLKVLNEIYSTEEQNKYGVVGIEIELI